MAIRSFGGWARRGGAGATRLTGDGRVPKQDAPIIMKARKPKIHKNLRGFYENGIHY